MDEDWVVSADWLADHLEDPDVRVIDVRDAWEYDGIGHVPGAVNVPFDEFRTPGEGPAGTLPPVERWEHLLADAGVTPETILVACDDTHGVFAARFLVTAHLYGHRRLALLDGDYSAWNRHHPVSQDAVTVAPAEYAVQGDPLGPDSPLVDADAVADAIGNPDVVLVDTRSAGEFAEGHLEGAVNLDWVDLVDDDTRGLRPAGEIRAFLAERGVVPEKRVLLYCNTARRISHTYVVLRWLGFADVAFYEGSLTEWREQDRDVV